MKKLLKFIRMSPEEKRLLGWAFIQLLSYRLRLACVPLQTFLDQVSRETARELKRNFPHQLSPERIARIITIAGNRVPFTTCMTKACAGQVIFARYGYETALYVGVSNSKPSGFKAHAWLKINESIILGDLPDLDKYKELPSIQKHMTH